MHDIHIRGQPHLGWHLNSATNTLGEVQVTFLGTTFDRIGEIVGVGSRRHVNLVLVRKEPKPKHQSDLRRSRWKRALLTS